MSSSCCVVVRGHGRDASWPWSWLAVLVVHVAGLAVGRVQELRLQLEDAVEVEAAAAEDRLQRHVGALRRGGSAPAG